MDNYPQFAETTEFFGKLLKSPGEKRELLRAKFPHHVWAVDFQLNQTKDGCVLKFLKAIDEYSRICQAIRVGRLCRAVEVFDTIEDLLKLYSTPIHLQMDNGPEFIAHALQEWCTGIGYNTPYIPARCTLGECIRGVV